LEQDNHKLELREKLRLSTSEYGEKIILNDLLEEIVEVSLTDKEKNFINNLIIAYLRKSEFRRKVPQSQIDKLLGDQMYLCNICGQKLNKREYHIDHIIPFKYVGDELENNYQILCNKCNQSKGANLIYLLKIFLSGKKITRKLKKR
jgi:5-methylcytosine-specific restriction endonuclease McrA